MDYTLVFICIVSSLGTGGMLLIAFLNWNKKQDHQLLTQAQFKLKRATRQQVLPLRLTAFERCILFAERANPQHLIPRSDAMNKTVRQFHLQLVQELRAEFEHNLTQQLYMSEDTWAEIVSLRESVITMIHKCAASLPENAPAHELARKVLEQNAMLPVPVNQNALSALKAEVKALF
jgi:hypothetical protein